jgi:uncharacterized membrane protein YccC
MSIGEQKMVARGVAAGTVMGLAIGLMIALFITSKTPGAVWFPSLFFPLALLVGWWGVLEFKAHERRKV